MWLEVETAMDGWPKTQVLAPTGPAHELDGGNIYVVSPGDLGRSLP